MYYTFRNATNLAEASKIGGHSDPLAPALPTHHPASSVHDRHRRLRCWGRCWFRRRPRSWCLGVSRLLHHHMSMLESVP